MHNTSPSLLLSLLASYFCIKYTGNDNLTLSENSSTVNVGTTVVVNMTYEANPLPMIRVTKDGINASSVDLLTTSQFTFNNVEEADSGIYDIEAVNFAGSAHAVFTLTVMKDGNGECTINCLHVAMHLSCLTLHI